MSKRPAFAVDLPEVERRVLGRHRPAADAPLAGCDPPPRQLQLQQGRIDGRKSQGEPAPARVRPRLELPVDPDDLLARRAPRARARRRPCPAPPTAGATPGPPRMAGVHGSSGILRRSRRHGADDQLGAAAEQSRVPSSPVSRPDQPGHRRPAACRPPSAARRPPAIRIPGATAPAARSPAGKTFVTSFAGIRTRRTTSGPAARADTPAIGASASASAASSSNADNGSTSPTVSAPRGRDGDDPAPGNRRHDRDASLCLLPYHRVVPQSTIDTIAPGHPIILNRPPSPGFPRTRDPYSNPPRRQAPPPMDIRDYPITIS